MATLALNVSLAETDSFVAVVSFPCVQPVTLFHGAECLCGALLGPVGALILYLSCWVRCSAPLCVQLCALLDCARSRYGRSFCGHCV